MDITRKCRDCGYSYDPSKDENVKYCPNCGHESWDGSVHASGATYTELDVSALSQQRQIEGERIKKTDLNTNANLSTDRCGPSKISIDRKERVPGFEQEGEVAETLLNSYNKLRNTGYQIKDKIEEDSDYADRIFVSVKDIPACIYIQIRHLDPKMAADVARKGAYQSAHTTEDFILSIKGAIADKARVDPDIKRKTLLQLILITPLDAKISRDIENSKFDFKDFKEIWISPFHQDSFPLNHL